MTMVIMWLPAAQKQVDKKHTRAKQLLVKI